MRKIIIGFLVLSCLVLSGVYGYYRLMSFEHLLVESMNDDIFAFYYLKHVYKMDPKIKTEYGLNPVSFVFNGCTQRMDASSDCHSILDHLLESGFDLAAPDETPAGLTPIHLPMLYSDRGLAQYVVSKKANLNVKALGTKFKGLTPIAFGKVLNEKHPLKARQEVIDFYVKNGGGE
jgi:hypothetical protein